MCRSSTYINLCMCVYEFMCMKFFKGYTALVAVEENL